MKMSFTIKSIETFEKTTHVKLESNGGEGFPVLDGELQIVYLNEANNLLPKIGDIINITTEK